MNEKESAHDAPWRETVAARRSPHPPGRQGSRRTISKGDRGPYRPVSALCARYRGAFPGRSYESAVQEFAASGGGLPGGVSWALLQRLPGAFKALTDGGMGVKLSPFSADMFLSRYLSPPRSPNTKIRYCRNQNGCQ